MAKTQGSQVYQLKNGRWAFRFSISVNGKQISKRGKTDLDGNPLLSRADATKARKMAIKMAQLAPLLPEKQPEPEKKTVRSVFLEYREKGCSDRAYATIRKQDSLWKNHLDAAFGDRIIDEIPTADVVDYLAKLYYEDGFAFRYVESFIKMFYLIFGQAYSRGYMSVDSYNRLCVNKDTKIHMPKLKIDEDLDVVAFTNEECAILDEYFTGTSGETAYLLGRYCGLRINEAYGLKWENVNIEQGTINIVQQMQSSSVPHSSSISISSVALMHLMKYSQFFRFPRRIMVNEQMFPIQIILSNHQKSWKNEKQNDLHNNPMP